MKSRRKLELDIAINALADGEADDAAQNALQRDGAGDALLRETLDETVRLKKLLAGHVGVEPNPFLAERIIRSAAETRHAATEQHSQPAFRPAAAIALGALVVALGIIGYLNRGPILAYLSSTQSAVQTAYDENVRGWLMPLFGKTSSDDVLQYAMFGTLPFDRSDGTVLRIDEHGDNGYRVEFARDTAQKARSTTVADLYHEIQPSSEQRRMFDSLFHYAGRQIESAVLFDEHDQLAIDPSITRFNRVILSSIAAGLTAQQRVRLDRFLEDRNTPYTLASVSEARQARSTEEVLRSVRELPRQGTFFVVGADTVSYASLDLDMDSLRGEMNVMQDRARLMQRQMQRLARLHATPASRSYRVRVPELRGEPHGNARMLATTLTSGKESIALSFEGEIDGLALDMETLQNELQKEFIVIRRRIQRVRSSADGRREVQIEHDVRVSMHPDSGEFRMYLTPDSGMQMELHIHEGTREELEELHDMNENERLRYFFPRMQTAPEAGEYDEKSILERNPAIIDSILLRHREELRDLQSADSSTQKRLNRMLFPEQREARPPDPPDYPSGGRVREIQGR